MRTTLDIDDDILAAAKERARLENKTAGQVISELARRALTAPASTPGGFHEADAAFDACDWPSFPGRAAVIVTHDQIKRIERELDLEDAGLVPPVASTPAAKPSRTKSNPPKGQR